VAAAAAARRFVTATLASTTEYYREGRRPVAIVGQPYAPAFECGKREGSVAEVERERGIRIVEFDPVLGWYSADSEELPTTLVVWTRRE
jgi:hypothetical protein